MVLIYLNFKYITKSSQLFTDKEEILRNINYTDSANE